MPLVGSDKIMRHKRIEKGSGGRDPIASQKLLVELRILSHLEYLGIAHEGIERLENGASLVKVLGKGKIVGFALFGSK